MNLQLHTMEEDRAWFEGDLLDRFTRYVRIHTTSDRHVAETPSSRRQFDLAEVLVAELKNIGLDDIYADDNCYIIARIAPTPGMEAVPAVGFMAHIDTAPDSNGKDVNPQVHANYDGGKISAGKDFVLDPSTFPALLDYQGQTVITTDGTSLLGADDKAGVAEIMSAAAYLVSHPEIPHGTVELIFTPDEEIGRGTDKLPLERLQSPFCYTVDGGDEGTVEAECFYAYRAAITCTGNVIHPGDARGKLANAVTMAGAFLSMLPRTESPEATDGRFGFYCPIEVQGDMAGAEIEMILRDFEHDEVKRRIDVLHRIAAVVEGSFPGGTVKVHTEEQYRNMRDELAKHSQGIAYLIEAIRATGMEPEMHSIRGGTDGARLTEKGIPTPNIFTGAHNMHGHHEWIALPSLVRAAKTVVNLVQLWTAETSESAG